MVTLSYLVTIVVLLPIQMGQTGLAIQRGVTLFMTQIVYTRRVIPKISVQSPVAITNSFVVAVHPGKLTGPWMAGPV